MKRNNMYIKVLKILKYDSKQSNMPLKDLCNDMSTNIELANDLGITLQELVAITNKIGKEVIQWKYLELILKTVIIIH